MYMLENLPITVPESILKVIKVKPLPVMTIL